MSCEQNLHDLVDQVPLLVESDVFAEVYHCIQFTLQVVIRISNLFVCALIDVGLDFLD